MTTFTTTALRIFHGGYHMPAPAAALRIAVLGFSIATTLTVDDQVFALLTGLITGTLGVITLWELHNTGVECERLDDEDQDDEDEPGFGMAA